MVSSASAQSWAVGSPALPGPNSTTSSPACTGSSATSTTNWSMHTVPLTRRRAGNRSEVLVAGRRRRVSGTVCMDQFVVDVADDPVQAGDEVVLFGPGSAGEPTAQDWAEALDTISYEVVSRIGPRVPRVYVGAGE